MTVQVFSRFRLQGKSHPALLLGLNDLQKLDETLDDKDIVFYYFKNKL